MPKQTALSLLTPLFLGFALFVTPACTKKLEPLPIGSPLLNAVGVHSTQTINVIEIALRTPAAPAWRVRLEKGNSKEGADEWNLVSRSDLPGSRDRADAKLVGHFLETLSTLNTESLADAGTDSQFGFQPYRVEIRLREGAKETVLLFGDPSGDGIYVRREKETETWTARGALIPFLGNLRSPSAFQLKSPFVGEFDGIARAEITKPGSGAWTFERPADQWLNAGKVLSGEQAIALEKILRQRILHVVDPAILGKEAVPTLPKQPDWIVKIAIGPERREETVSLYFILDQIYVVNPNRTEFVMELYPEAAGALRAFTQARFTPVKSSTK